ncbi:MAG: peptide chain release factor 3 [Clostridia bacterium]|nr:peptide chain release factor 3 [Clostridia bacterium]
MEQQINKRRTFAIISHPDAGKTTLTEKLLLYGGAIQSAGMVKGKRSMKHAVSDWMEIEKQRGISVTSSVLQFEYGDCCINILDTPGHEDFSEDTYRTLMAADSAVMVIDASKGVERQTKKLFKVCVMRHIPIFTFINKMDREARDPFDLLEEIEQVLGIETYPMNWPMGSGRDFRGVYDRGRGELLAFTSDGNGSHAAQVTAMKPEDEALDAMIGEQAAAQLRDDIELLDGAGSELDMDRVQKGELSPVFFGSALTNFGVEPFLREFLKMTTPPLPRKADTGLVDPVKTPFSAFVFKIQANMNKAHRDRIAFMRICSGRFEKGMEVVHVQSGKKMRLSQPQQMMASDREIIEEAYAGDIMGVFDPGMFSIGDTLCAPGNKFVFEGIPTFEPEIFRLVRQVDTMKRKQFVKGMTQIAQEGAIQIFQEPGGGMEEVIVGVVGTLQFDVLEHRLNNEYGVQVRMEPLSYQFVRWIESEVDDPRSLDLTSDTKYAQDMRGRPLLLFSSEWNIRWAQEHNKTLKLADFGRN